LEKKRLDNNFQRQAEPVGPQMSSAAHEQQMENLRKQLELERVRAENMSRELERFKEKPLERPRVVKNPAANLEVSPKVSDPVISTDGNRHPPRSAVRRFKCNGLGHFARNCRSTSKVDSVQTREPSVVPHDPESSDSARVSDRVPEHISGATSQEEKQFMRESYLSLKIGGKSVMCLLDTGAEATSILSSLTRGMQLRPSKQTFRAANGTVIAISGEVSFKAVAGLHRFTVTGCQAVCPITCLMSYLV